MATSYTPVQLERLRRDAKKLGRERSITHSEALDRVAAEHGYANWSLLVKRSALASSRFSPDLSAIAPGKWYTDEVRRLALQQWDYMVRFNPAVGCRQRCAPASDREA